MIRVARISDLTELLGLCERAWSKGIYGTLPLDRSKTLQQIRLYIKSDQLFAWVSVRKKRVVGVLAGHTHTLEMSHCTSASDQVFYVEEGADGVSLLKCFLYWAKSERKADMIAMTISSDEKCERVSDLLQSQGLILSGSIYYWVRPNCQASVGSSKKT